MRRACASATASACCSTSTRSTLDAASAYVLTGVNGAGKSTLLRVLAGLERGRGRQRATSTASAVRAASVSRRRCARAIVYVHQHPIMFSTSVAHNIGYGLQARGVPKAQRGARRSTRRWPGPAWRTCATPIRPRCRAARSSAWRWRAPRCCSPSCCCSTNRPRTWTAPAREQVIALIPTLLEAGSSVVMACHDRDLIGLPGVRRLKLRDGQHRISITTKENTMKRRNLLAVLLCAALGLRRWRMAQRGDPPVHHHQHRELGPAELAAAGVRGQDRHQGQRDLGRHRQGARAGQERRRRRDAWCTRARWKTSSWPRAGASTGAT